MSGGVGYTVLRRERFIALQVERLEPSPEHPHAYLMPPRPPLDVVLTRAADAAAIAHAHREPGHSMRTPDRSDPRRTVPLEYERAVAASVGIEKKMIST